MITQSFKHQIQVFTNILKYINKLKKYISNQKLEQNQKFSKTFQRILTILNPISTQKASHLNPSNLLRSM